MHRNPRQRVWCWMAFLACSLSIVLAISACNESAASDQNSFVGDVATNWSFGRHGTEAGQFVEPRAIAASEDGKIFVIDRTGRIQRFDSSGKYEHGWTMPDNDQRGKPSGIDVDRWGRVLVADTHRHRVVGFDRDGKELFRFGEVGTGPGQMMFPTDVAVDSEGCFYVCEFGGEDRVNKFSATQEFLFSFAGISDGSAAVQRPSAITIDDEDRIWVADTSNHRLVCFDSNGVFVRSVGRFGYDAGELRYPRDVIVGRDSIFAVDCENNRICEFDRSGRFRHEWGIAGRGQGEVHLPLNATLLGQTIFLADTKNHRIQAIPWELNENPRLALASRSHSEENP